MKWLPKGSRSEEAVKKKTNTQGESFLFLLLSKKKKWNLGRILSYRFKVQLTPTEFGWPVPVKESNKKDTGNENTNKQNGGPDGPFVILRSPAFPRLQIYLLH